MDFGVNPEVWKFAVIPVVAALIGWSTNWLAIKLTFYPIEFKGLRPLFGWQGIIPSKAEKMAMISVDSTISKISTVQEVFQQIDPNILAQHIVDSFLPRAEDYVDDIMLQEHATLWENLPSSMKELVYSRVRKSAPRLIEQLMEDIGEQIEELIDIKQMVTRQLVADKQLLNRIFLECGAQEFRFIINSGFAFGFCFGLMQMALWYIYPANWVLPICGFIVGWATNWIALNIIFRPLNPVSLGPLKIHGLFLKRQKDVAASFCKIVTHEILTVGRIVNSMLNGPYSARTRALIRKHVKPVVDETAGITKPLTQIALGPKAFADLKQKVGDKAIDISAATFDNPMFNEERAATVEKTMRERMEAMSSAEFQNLLRPCFQEDEIKLIIIGGILGALAGFGQLVLVF
jgi:uncharacterized membrane protein YheB (UPF0754 family)